MARDNWTVSSRMKSRFLEEKKEEKTTKFNKQIKRELFLPLQKEKRAITAQFSGAICGILLYIFICNIDWLTVTGK